MLVVAHDADGAVGIVLNRRSETEVSDAVPELAALVDDGARVWVGGPVQGEAVVVLGEWDDHEEAGSIVFGDVGLMGAEAELDAVVAATRRVRVFAGYVGWSGGQLEVELEEPSWIVEDAQLDDVFGESSDLWADVLRRKGGPYALLATMPEDPTLN